MPQRWKERITLTDAIMWLIGGMILSLILWGSAATLATGRYTVHHWFDFVAFGLAQGSIYALIAMGYTMVYGTLRMINFAHSEVFMSGPYTAYYVAAFFYSSGFLDRQPNHAVNQQTARPGQCLPALPYRLQLTLRIADWSSAILAQACCAAVPYSRLIAVP